MRAVLLKNTVRKLYYGVSNFLSVILNFRTLLCINPVLMYPIMIVQVNTNLEFR